MPLRGTGGRFISPVQGGGQGPISITIRYDPVQYKQLQQSVASLANITKDTSRKEFVQMFRPLAQRMERSIKSATPKHSGKLRDGWKLTQEHRGQKISFKLTNSMPYLLFVMKGTGLEGPRHQRIYPPSTRFFRDFEWKGKKYRRVNSTKGQAPNTALTTAFDEAGEQYTVGASQLLSTWFISRVELLGKGIGKGGSGSSVMARIAMTGGTV